jgi:hypothetical protein
VEIGCFGAFISDSNHAPSMLKTPARCDDCAPATGNTSFQLGNLFTAPRPSGLLLPGNNHRTGSEELKHLLETIRCAYEIDISLSARSLRPRKKSVKRFGNGVRRGKVNKRPLKSIIAGFIMLKLLVGRVVWKKKTFTRKRFIGKKSIGANDTSASIDEVELG